MSIFDRARGVLEPAPKAQEIDVKKAVTTDSAPLALDTQTADRFIDFVEDQSVLIGLMRVVRMDTCSQDLGYVDVNKKVLRPSECRTDDSNCDTGGITATRQTLETHEFKAIIPLCDDFLDCNIEGAQFEDHLLRMVTDQIANELEIWVLMASLGLEYHSPEVDDSLLALDDTLYQILQTGHVLNAATDDDRFISPCKITAMIKELPVKYRKRIEDFLLFMPDNMKWDWVAKMKNRGTALGDTAITGSIPLRYGDLDFMPLPLLPTDVRFCSGGSQSEDGTFMFLSDPDNLVLGIQTDITFERERKACQGRTLLVWKLRVDALIDNVDATVLYDCMRDGGCVDCECPE